MPRIRSVLGAAVAVAGWSVMAASPALAATTTVTPSSGLHDRDVVQVSVTGLQDNAPYDIAECQLAVTRAHPGDPGPGCDPDAANVMTDGSGTLTTHLTIHTGQIGNDPGSVCTASTNGQCGVVVAVHGFGSIAGTATVSFAGTVTPNVTSSASRTTVPAGKKFRITGRAASSGSGVNGLKVSVLERPSSHHKWTTAKTTKTRTIKGQTGRYRFTLKGHHHAEQYKVRHRTQHLHGVTYKAAEGKTIKTRP